MIEPYELTRMSVSGLPPDTFILDSDSIDELLIAPGRRLVGLERQNKAYRATVTWLRAMQDLGLIPEDPRNICTVTVMAEGIGHNLPGALAAVLAGRPHRGDNWIGVSRYACPKRAGDRYTPFEAKVSYVRIHSNAKVWALLDTVATGATLVRGLETAFANVEKPQQILFATPAGSGEGVGKIARLCQKEHVDFTAVFFGAIFGLWEDGTGLPWCHPDTVLSGTPRSMVNRELTQRLFNNLPGFCSVGDCSANFFDVEDAFRILSEEEARFEWYLPTLKEVVPTKVSVSVD
jgi:hypothetical protein